MHPAHGLRAVRGVVAVRRQAGECLPRGRGARAQPCRRQAARQRAQGTQAENVGDESVLGASPRHRRMSATCQCRCVDYRNPRGAYIAGKDGTIKVWDTVLSRGQRIHHLRDVREVRRRGITVLVESGPPNRGTVLFLLTTVAVPCYNVCRADDGVMCARCRVTVNE